MEWNIAEKMIVCCDYEYTFPIDYLKNTIDQKEYQNILKQLKSFKPALNVEDVIVVARTGSKNKEDVYGVVFTKDKIYFKDQKAYSLYGITNVEYKSRFSGFLSKKYSLDVTISYDEQDVKMTFDRPLYIHTFSLLQEIYSCGTDGIVKDTFKENREKALKELEDGNNYLFEAYLESYADHDKDACVMLMNYYLEKGNYYGYQIYKEKAMEQHAPDAFYHEACLHLIEGDIKKAYPYYLRAYASGFDSSICPKLIQLRQQIKGINNDKKKPYQYNDLDIDPDMIDCIYPEAYIGSYLRFLKQMDVDQSSIDEWCFHNISNSHIKPTKEDKKFYEELSENMEESSMFHVSYYSMTDFADEVRKTLIPHVKSNDNMIKQFINGFDPLIITNLPVRNFNDYRLTDLNIGCFLDERAYIGQSQYASFDNKGAYNYIQALKDYPDYKKKRLNSSKKESIAFLEKQITGYEDLMRLYKRTVNRFLALIYMWATPSAGMNILAFDREEYILKAKERVLLMDKEFLQLKNDYFMQMGITDQDLFKDRSFAQELSMQEMKNAGSLLLSTKDVGDTYGYFYVYENDKNLNYPLNDFMKKVGVKFNKEDILFYESISFTGFSEGIVLTKDYLYSTYLSAPIPTQGLIALQVTPYDKMIALYKDGQTIDYCYKHNWKYTARRIVNFVNEMLIYLW